MDNVFISAIYNITLIINICTYNIILSSMCYIHIYIYIYTLYIYIYIYIYITNYVQGMGFEFPDVAWIYSWMPILYVIYVYIYIYT